MFNIDPQQILLRIPPVLLALTVHEYAHGWVARRCGDRTAERAGRLTLNPLVHLDPFGTLMLLFGPFGWARPVPVNPQELANPKRDMILVSAAGPGANILTALAAGMLLRMLSWSGMGMRGTTSGLSFLVSGLVLLFLVSIGLSFFNLMPVPPLDGSKILMGFLPPARIQTYLSYMRHVPKVFVALLVAEWLLGIRVFSMVFMPLFRPYLAFWNYVIFGQKVLML
jgi:Zn-dependent protease